MAIINMMDQEQPTQLDLEDKIRELTAQLEAVKATATVVPEDVWPKQFVVNFHSDREEKREWAIKHGMAPEVVNKFKLVLPLVTVTIEVEKDGSYKVIDNSLFKA